MELKILRLLLSRDWFSENKDRLTAEMFDGHLKDIYTTIRTAQEKYQRDLTVEEVRELHASSNPALSQATKIVIADAFSDIKSATDIGPDVAADILASMWRRETFRQIAEIAVNGIDGKVPDLEAIRRIVESRSASFEPADEVEWLDTDLDAILAANDEQSQWRINIPTVAEKLPGISGGELMILFARPETGKTASYVSLACAPGGWCWQGARVLVLCNEEPGRRTLLRAVTAACQQDKAWVRQNQAGAEAEWSKIKDRFIMGDAVGLTTAKVDALVRRYAPDIVVCDQLDKIAPIGSFAATHEKLRDIYMNYRETAKRHHCAAVAVSQASAEAEGKTVLNPTMMEGSKTGKFAEADVIIGIGKFPLAEGSTEEDFTRTWTVGKNKISSWHGTVHTILDPHTSTYRS